MHYSDPSQPMLVSSTQLYPTPSNRLPICRDICGMGTGYTYFIVMDWIQPYSTPSARLPIHRNTVAYIVNGNLSWNWKSNALLSSPFPCGSFSSHPTPHTGTDRYRPTRGLEPKESVTDRPRLTAQIQRSCFPPKCSYCWFIHGERVDQTLMMSKHGTSSDLVFTPTHTIASSSLKNPRNNHYRWEK